MKFHPDLQAIIDKATEEHGESVGKSVAFGLALGTYAATTAVFTSAELTPKEEADLGNFVVAHLSFLSDTYDAALGLTEEERRTSSKVINEAHTTVFELLQQGVNEVVLIN